MKKIALVLFLGFMFSTVAVAGSNCDAHTWDSIHVEDSGVWQGTLSPTSEASSFVNTACANITTMTVTKNSPFSYGFKFPNEDDFDMAYTLTLTEHSTAGRARFVSKTCVFVVTATGPAQPDVQVLSYNGAQCRQQNTGTGDEFFVS